MRDLTARPPVLVLVGIALTLCLSSAADAAQEQRALLDLVVNDVDKGQVLTVIRGDQAWVAVAALERADLRGFTGEREVQNGLLLVRLGSLAPDLRYTLSEQDLTLRLTAAPNLLSVHQLRLQANRPTGLVYSRNRSAFVNYAVNWNGVGRPGLFTDTGVSIGGALVSTMLMQKPDGPWVRGQSSVTFDDRTRLRRWVLGDTFANTGPLGGAAFLGGISVSREYGLDPYFQRYPTLDMSGAVMTPSTVEVYVNDRLVQHEDIGPGRFDVAGIPMSTGRGMARLVVRDAFGREQELVSSFYLTRGILAPGLQEYSYHAGYERLYESTSSWQYSTPIVMGRHRVGVNDWLTWGFRGEAGSQLVNLGPTMNIRLPVGELGVDAATSRDGSGSALGGSVGYSYTSRAISAGTTVRYFSPGYATVGSGSGLLSVRHEVSTYAGVPLGTLVSLTGRHTVATRIDRTRTNVTSLLASVRVSRLANLFVTGTNDWTDRQAGWQVFAGLGFSLGRRTTANVSIADSGGAQHASFDVQQSLPAGTGYGYRVSNDFDRARGSGTLQYQGPFGRYEAWHDAVDGVQTTSFRATGGIVAIGGSVFPTRPVQDGFALIRVPDVPDVRAYASNQEIGKTDRHGNLLVPGLLPYYGNKLSIADEDVPLDRTVAQKERLIAPPYRGGVLVTFPVSRTHTTRGRILLFEDGKPTVVPVFGQLTVQANGRPFESPIGEGGEFYLENLPSGRYQADVQHEQRVCQFVLEIPAGLGTVNVGTVSCVMAEAR